MTWTFAGVDAELADEPARGRARSARRRVDALVEAPLRVALAAARLARQHVVGGQHERARRGSRCTSSGWTVSHWKCTTSASARRAAVAQHVGDVAGQLRAQRARAPGRRRAAVEASRRA